MKTILFALTIFMVTNLFAQNTNVPVSVSENSILINDPSTTIIWENPEKGIGNAIELSGTVQKEFTCFGFGISTGSEILDLDEIQILFRTRENNKQWSEWKTTEFDVLPSETPTEMYWTDLLFNSNQNPHADFEIQITGLNIEISSVRADFINIGKSLPGIEYSAPKPGGCPPFPTIITRETWLVPYYGEQSYTPTVIYPTHVVIHHGASPDTYTDGAAVVRSYWNYHVNTLGWSDIGYNYLCDKYGNLYQGRKNSDMEGQDVRGAHAGASNDGSIGMNFLGNADVTVPTTVQLEACYALLGWWFDTRGFDPTSSASLILQSTSAAAVVPRILGHKDTNIGGTSCPGDVLYAQLATMRTQVKAVIDACLSVPTTSVAPVAGWQTTNFNASFTDADQEISFYQVLDNNGTEWRANGSHGFINDNFTSAIHPDWTSISGNWIINSGHLNQTNEDSSNTNFYIPVTQVSGNAYIYHFQMNIGGSGSNRRAGLHFFCDDPDMIQRNNSYMIYFRADNNKCQIYKAVDDNITLYTDDDCTVAANTWYDYKIIFNTTTGEISAFQNDVLVSSWTDPSPYTAGGYLSLRTGNCNVQYDDVKVYKSRTATQNVTVGSTSAQVRYCNSSPSTPSCRIKSVVVSEFDKISLIDGEDVNVDWTAPASFQVYDGIASDIDTFYLNTEITGSWDATTDANSGVSFYEYCVGTSSGGTEIVGWTNNGTSTEFTLTGLSLTYSTDYFVSVRAKNNAGIYSTVCISDGQYLKEPFAEPVCNFTWSSAEICAGDSIVFISNSTDATAYSWSITGGIPSSSSSSNVVVYFSEPGIYTASLSVTGPGGTDELSQDFEVIIHPIPLALFNAIETYLQIPEAVATFVNNSENADWYHWDFGDGGTSSDQNPWHEYTSTGMFDILLVAGNEYCGADTTLLTSYIEVVDLTDVNEITKNNITLYPNPFTDAFTITSNESLLGSKIKLIDITGKEVFSTIIEKNVLSAEIKIQEELSSGIYTIQIFKNGKQNNLRIIRRK
ncbi:MAG: hypothetical protein A2W91_18225 [Bacteroidetes bacterium GWF2_38_335]|nr:MAG: hypothetical protein A2W91_18225 [Bacteroidetes bacterium GWF2_38_335]OFY80097.1 MAG: hypothetical protein A2281_12415 [Bacteroidetes bacterium RIFOXYA12_FULL_38_20]HBS88577.1 hypothetical protein [Bacteroidales bacterium]